MRTPEESEYTIAISELDRSLLPHHLRAIDHPQFTENLREFIEAQYAELGGTVRVVFDHDNDAVNVRWSPYDQTEEHPFAAALRKLEAGHFEEGVQLLELLRFAYTDNPDVFYNLGIALNELGRFSEARAHLSKALEMKPDNTNAMVGLAIALSQQGELEGAIFTLKTALEYEPQNPWAHKNIGALLLKKGDSNSEAAEHFFEALVTFPEDQQALYGVAQTLLVQNKNDEADSYLKKAIAVNEHTPIADLAKHDRTRIAEQGFRSKAENSERMDAVSYCLDALERFEMMSEQQVRDIGVEIAVLGQQGINTNDISKRYTLQSVEGEFSGLHLVCMLYVAFQQIAPGQDVGFDLSKEYETAKHLHTRNTADQ